MGSLSCMSQHPSDADLKQCVFATLLLLSSCAGTLSGNPLAMTAGIKTLEILDRPGSYEHLDKVTGRLINGIMDAAKEAGHAITGGHISGERMPCGAVLCADSL